MAIDKLLAHNTVYGDKVAIMGQSKGAEISAGVACMLPNKIEVALLNSSYIRQD
jgi:acetyl esterase/lipase